MVCNTDRVMGQHSAKDNAASNGPLGCYQKVLSKEIQKEECDLEAS